MWRCLSFILLVSSLSAAEPLAFVDEPDGCLQKAQYPCAVRILQAAYRINSEIATIWGSSGVAFILGKNKNLRLVDGEILLTTKKTLTLDEGLIQLQGSGDLWISKKGQRILARNLLGQLKVSDQNGKFFDDIPAGFQKWYDGLNHLGKIEQGTLAAIDAETFIPQWTKMNDLPREQALEKLEAFKKNWQGVVEEIAQFYQQIAERRIATIEEADQRRQQKQLLEMKEREKLRRLFRNKQYLDQF
jgi:hypothetical protein